MERISSAGTYQSAGSSKHFIGATRHLSSLESINYAETKRAGPRPGTWKNRRQLVWRHYKRWWCCYTMIFIVAAAVGLPILFLVIFPAIAQDLVNSAHLPIHSASIMNPTPTSVEYSLIASIKVPLNLAVHLDPLTIELYNPTTKPNIIPYMQVSLPEERLKGETTLAVVNQTAVISNSDQFQEFLTQAIYAENFTLAARGSTTAHLGDLKAHITLDKEIELAALNNLSGYSIDSAEVVLPPEADGTNLKGIVVIPNDSIVTFELGNVTLDMIIGDLVVGQATLLNVLLEPGNNTLPIQGIIDIKTAFENLSEILAAQSSALRSGNIEITAAGNSVVFNGQHIPYYENVLKQVRLTAEMPILSILTDSLGGFLGSNSSLITGLTQALNSTDVLSGLLGSLDNLNATLGSLSNLKGI